MEIYKEIKIETLDEVYLICNLNSCKELVYFDLKKR